jgi:hypothetical protein
MKSSVAQAAEWWQGEVLITTDFIYWYKKIKHQYDFAFSFQ